MGFNDCKSACYDAGTAAPSIASHIYEATWEPPMSPNRAVLKLKRSPGVFFKDLPKACFERCSEDGNSLARYPENQRIEPNFTWLTVQSSTDVRTIDIEACEYGGERDIRYPSKLPESLSTINKLGIWSSVIFTNWAGYFIIFLNLLFTAILTSPAQFVYWNKNVNTDKSPLYWLVLLPVYMINGGLIAIMYFSVYKLALRHLRNFVIKGYYNMNKLDEENNSENENINFEKKLGVCDRLSNWLYFTFGTRKGLTNVCISFSCVLVGAGICVSFVMFILTHMEDKMWLYMAVPDGLFFVVVTFGVFFPKESQYIRYIEDTGEDLDKINS